MKNFIFYQCKLRQLISCQVEIDNPLDKHLCYGVKKIERQLEFWCVIFAGFSFFSYAFFIYKF